MVAVDPAGASTLGASTRWDQRVSAPAVATDDADDDVYLLLLLILEFLNFNTNSFRG